MKKTGIIIQARMGSSRLSGKMIKPFYEGKGILELLLQRLKEYFSHRTDLSMLVATSVNPADDIILEIGERCGFDVFRGSEHDVLLRFIEAASYIKADRLIRVCADNPFLDMEAIEVLCRRICANDVDYVAYATSEGIPTIKTHYGFWAEAVSADALALVSKETPEMIYHEHVTNYIYTHPDKFAIDYIQISREIEDNSNIRLTLDTPEDFDMQRIIFKYCIEKFGKIDINSVLQTLNSFPEFQEQMKRQIELNNK